MGTESTWDEAKGRAKEAAGAATDNDSLKNEGKVDQTKASAKDAIDKVGDKVGDFLNKDDNK